VGNENNSLSFLKKKHAFKHFNSLAFAGKHILAPLALALAVAHPAHARGADGYTSAQFKPTMEPPASVQVSITTYRTRAELQTAARQMGAEDSPTLAAFSARTESGSRCTIHTLDPAVRYEPAQVGHELYHCFFGNWHRESYRPVLARGR